MQLFIQKVHFFFRQEFPLLLLFRWLSASAVVGALTGMLSSLFVLLLDLVASYRIQHSWVLYLLLATGLFIVWIYHWMQGDHPQGTNLVLASIHSKEQIPIRMIPLIFLSTIATHLAGGSAGRTGAGMQMGGSLGNTFGKILRFDDNDRRILIMCGVSAAFAVICQAPAAGSFFALEVVSVGIMHYSALIPCITSALIAFQISLSMGIDSPYSHLSLLPELSVSLVFRMLLLAMLFALVSTLFCLLLHKLERGMKKLLPNPYIRIVAGGILILLATLILGTQAYNGVSEFLTLQALGGNAGGWDFLLKMLLTAVTLGAGFKGGEIAPTFCIGATFGCFAGGLLGLPPALCAALGFGAVFCGVTNCPVTSILLCVQLFGSKGLLYYLPVIAVSYILSGYHGLYASQKIVYSKYKTEYINITAKE